MNELQEMKEQSKQIRKEFDDLKDRLASVRQTYAELERMTSQFKSA